MAQRIRRVVTGHDKDGKSAFVMDGKAPNVLEMASMPGVALRVCDEIIESKAGEQRH